MRNGFLPFIHSATHTPGHPGWHAWSQLVLDVVLDAWHAIAWSRGARPGARVVAARRARATPRPGRSEAGAYKKITVPPFPPAFPFSET